MGDLQSQNLYPAQTYVNTNGDKNQQAISRFGAGYQGSEDMYMNRKPQSQDNYKVRLIDLIVEHYVRICDFQSGIIELFYLNNNHRFKVLKAVVINFYKPPVFL